MCKKEDSLTSQYDILRRVLTSQYEKLRSVALLTTNNIGDFRKWYLYGCLKDCVKAPTDQNVYKLFTTTVGFYSDGSI